MTSWTAGGRPGHRELVCEGCGTTAPADATGWRGEVAEAAGEAEEARIALYCPDCWTREFESE